MCGCMMVCMVDTLCDIVYCVSAYFQNVVGLEQQCMVSHMAACNTYGCIILDIYHIQITKLDYIAASQHVGNHL
jgi:hypothetical protein